MRNRVRRFLFAAHEQPRDLAGPLCLRRRRLLSAFISPFISWPIRRGFTSICFPTIAVGGGGGRCKRIVLELTTRRRGVFDRLTADWEAGEGEERRQPVIHFCAAPSYNGVCCSPTVVFPSPLPPTTSMRFFVTLLRVTQNKSLVKCWLAHTCPCCCTPSSDSRPSCSCALSGKRSTARGTFRSLFVFIAWLDAVFVQRDARHVHLALRIQRKWDERFLLVHGLKEKKRDFAAELRPKMRVEWMKLA